MTIQKKDSPKVCPHSGKIIAAQKQKGLFFCLFLLTGIGSLIWFLIRVIPKPSRASYPCQRVVAPLASGFVIWLIATAASFAIFRQAKQLYRRSRFVLGLICLCVAVIVGIIALINAPDKSVSAAALTPNQPIGVAQGVHPGRVVWVHDPNATQWAGWQGISPPDNYMFDDRHTDPCVVSNMFSKGIRAYAGTTTDANAWQAIFCHFNQLRNKGNIGYTPGEKVTIKINLVTCIWWANMVGEDYQKIGWLYRADASPQLLHALLWQLVHVVGVAQSDIAIGDTLALFCNQWYNYLHADFPDVVYYDYRGTLGRTLAVKTSDPNHKIYFGNHGTKGSEGVTALFADAEYVINLANLKGHSSGVTLCAKNLYGSLCREPYEGSFDLHLSLAKYAPGMGRYRALVDLMGNKDLGGKTILYMIDGLYGGYYFDSFPYKWKMAPFNNDWPSSIFVSMDPVAIDSVAYDFLNQEWPDVVTYGDAPRSGPAIGAEDYLHEAALADNPPSGTDYNPNGDTGPGPHLASLGTHEHWNNPIDKEYSRNLGSGNGIELIAVNNDNKPPVVEAGPDLIIHITEANDVNLVGIVRDDGLPIPHHIHVRWSKVSGPGSVNFLDDEDVNTIAQFSSPGVYVVRLDANDGNLESYDQATISIYGPADFNNDGAVDLIDFSILGSQWQQTPGTPSADIAPPYGIVDENDLCMFAEEWLTGN